MERRSWLIWVIVCASIFKQAIGSKWSAHPKMEDARQHYIQDCLHCARHGPATMSQLLHPLCEGQKAVSTTRNRLYWWPRSCFILARSFLVLKSGMRCPCDEMLGKMGCPVEWDARHEDNMLGTSVGDVIPGGIQWTMVITIVGFHGVISL